MRSFAVGCGAVLAGCSESALLEDPTGRMRIVAQVASAGDDAKDAAAVGSALAGHDPVAAVVALTAGGLRAVHAAASGQGRAGLRIVGVDAVPAAGLAPNETIVVESTGAGVAVELALLACSGIALPPPIAVGTRTVTAANAAAGGAPRLAPGDMAIEMLRRQHPDVITTQPATDVVFRVAFVQVRNDGWHDRVRDEVQAAARRHPQLELQSFAGDGSAVRLRALLDECLQANVRVILLSVEDRSPLAAVAAAAAALRIPLVAIDPLASSVHVTTAVGCDQEILGRAVGEAVKALLPEGGACIEVHGDLGSELARRRHQGFVAALGLKAR